MRARTKVYHHFDPETLEVVYIGSGVDFRPWDTGGRSTDHKDWLKSLDLRGLCLSDVVFVVAKCLPQQEARFMENCHIRVVRPRFNKQLKDFGSGTEPVYVTKTNAKGRPFFVRKY